jgi:hypothetical protein
MTEGKASISVFKLINEKTLFVNKKVLFIAKNNFFVKNE